MNAFIFVATLILSVTAGAEETTCTVKGMHCTGCTEMVEGKLCAENKYKTCEVKILDEKNEIGQLRVEPKDAKTKVDEKAIAAIIVDAGYKIEKCKASKKVATPPPAKAS